MSPGHLVLAKFENLMPLLRPTSPVVLLVDTIPVWHRLSVTCDTSPSFETMPSGAMPVGKCCCCSLVGVARRAATSGGEGSDRG